MEVVKATFLWRRRRMKITTTQYIRIEFEDGSVKYLSDLERMIPNLDELIEQYEEENQ